MTGSGGGGGGGSVVAIVLTGVSTPFAVAALRGLFKLFCGLFGRISGRESFLLGLIERPPLRCRRLLPPEREDDGEELREVEEDFERRLLRLDDERPLFTLRRLRSRIRLLPRDDADDDREEDLERDLLLLLLTEPRLLLRRRVRERLLERLYLFAGDLGRLLVAPAGGGDR